MHWELKKELGRKLIHLTSVFILVIYIAIGRYSTKLALFSLAVILILLLEFQYVRLDFEKKPKIIRYIEQFRREKEKNTIGGEVFFMIGAILCLAIFDFRIATAAILMTTFGDLSAALIGKRFGKHRIFRLKKNMGRDSFCSWNKRAYWLAFSQNSG